MPQQCHNVMSFHPYMSYTMRHSIAGHSIRNTGQDFAMLCKFYIHNAIVIATMQRHCRHAGPYGISYTLVFYAIWYVLYIWFVYGILRWFAGYSRNFHTKSRLAINAHSQHNATTRTLRLAYSFGCIARLGLLVIERSTFQHLSTQDFRFQITILEI